MSSMVNRNVMKNQKECNPINYFSLFFIGITILSIIWCFYSVAIELLPMHNEIITCPEYSKILSNWTPEENTICKNYLDGLTEFKSTESTFWSLMTIAGSTPWIVFCMVAVITSHDKITKKHKQSFLVFLGILIGFYFLSLIIASFNGIKVYLYSSPAYIGVPLVIVIPSIVGYMKYQNISKKVHPFINPLVIIIYIMISISLIILTSYIVWIPTSYKGLLYKGSIIIGCAWYFAWLAAVVMSYELMYVYTYKKYPEIQDYDIKTIKPNNIESNSIESNNVEPNNVESNSI